MMKNLWLMGSAALMFAGGWALPAQTVDFADDIASWKTSRVGVEAAGKGIRMNVVAKAQGNYGMIYKYLPAIPEGKYIQIKVDALENSKAFGWTQSSSNSVKRSFGVIFQGVNTYSPLAKTKFAFGINQLHIFDVERLHRFCCCKRIERRDAKHHNGQKDTQHVYKNFMQSFFHFLLSLRFTQSHSARVHSLSFLLSATAACRLHLPLRRPRRTGHRPHLWRT